MGRPIDLGDEGDDPAPCARCTERAIDRGELEGVIPPDVAREIPGGLADELVRCVRCLAHDGVTIDRCHVERALMQFGAVAEPLPERLVERAVAARPELAGAAVLVSEPDAVLVHPAELTRQRIAMMAEAGAPEMIIARGREQLATLEPLNFRPEWERVHAWPAPARFPGTVARGAIARALAEHAIPALVRQHEVDAILGAVARAAAALSLDLEARVLHQRLSAAVLEEPASRRARGLELAVRFLDELGHTGLLTNQDTLLDDCYFTLDRHGAAGAARRIYRVWLEVAVPQAWRAIERERTTANPSKR